MFGTVTIWTKHLSRGIDTREEIRVGSYPVSPVLCLSLPSVSNVWHLAESMEVAVCNSVDPGWLKNDNVRYLKPRARPRVARGGAPVVGCRFQLRALLSGVEPESGWADVQISIALEKRKDCICEIE